ncbi:MAG: sulfite exporter TauE/SafE family protein [Defluviitaleaceae bacterium]|nr:sulfite exporter TauE/SafE family protein [Defluviitaleaceae bacterium]MCL2275501.1 sulfite exporter TauE/SafE family protein [Defluviitaleaceae bacterium]
MKTSLKKHITAIIGTVAGIANGLFGAGGGTILVPALERFIPLDTHKAHATALAVMLPLSIVSAVIYTLSNQVEVQWLTVLYVSVGGLVGGIIGAKLLKKLSAAWLNILFGLFLAVGAIRMLFA